MKLAPECRSCLLEKVRTQSAFTISDTNKLDRIVAKCAGIYDAGYARKEGAAVTAGAVHRCCCAEVGIADLYTDIKTRDNKRAAEVLATVRPMLKTVHDALIASVIGNAMDYGVTGHTVETDFTRFFETIFTHGLAIDDSAKFLPLCKHVVFFTDNCGEVIFDMQFIKMLKETGAHVTVVVKDGPMLNDVTQKEAEEIGIGRVADAVYTGGGGQQLGAHPEYFPPEVRTAVENATLLIAKGLANYESLTEYDLQKPIAYLMMIKCDAVGRDVGAKKGDLVAFLRGA
ncbi:MAG: ARMT1-like domain-containing protein [Methanocorpusculum sp.]|nr:ARMT1-like domain-containing protein [Methanocorpusculum sp.]